MATPAGGSATPNGSLRNSQSSSSHHWDGFAKCGRCRLPAQPTSLPRLHPCLLPPWLEAAVRGWRGQKDFPPPNKSGLVHKGSKLAQAGRRHERVGNRKLWLRPPNLQMQRTLNSARLPVTWPPALRPSPAPLPRLSASFVLHSPKKGDRSGQKGRPRAGGSPGATGAPGR